MDDAPRPRLLAAARRPGVAVPAGIVVLALGGAGAVAALGSGGSREAAQTPSSVKQAPPPEEPGDFQRPRRPQVVQLDGGSAQPGAAARDDAPSPGAQSDADVRAELREARSALADFKRHLGTSGLTTGPRAKVLPDGTAQAPEDAPGVVKRVIQAANAIAKFPYKWGGGHGAWRDSGYDCSGSVSFALAGAGLLRSPLASGGFMDYGEEGEGEWITMYTNPGHMFMVVAGLRFDTSGRGRAGTRWQQAPRTVSGYTVRHPPRF